jgi:light-regulated signal transduction histidine kinase (bacteriophytochrome)
MSQPKKSAIVSAQLVVTFVALLLGLAGLAVWGFAVFDGFEERAVLSLGLVVIFVLSVALRRISHKLRELADELEDMVAQRTMNLNVARERLEAELVTRKALETELEHTIEELRVANRELEEFAYVASHDLQEPLRKIQAFGNRLEARYGEALDDTGRDYLARMQKAAGRMSHLISDLLELSRVTTQARPFEQVSLEEVVANVLSDMEITLEEHGVNVDVGELPTVSGDAAQLERLFQNLLSNAVKFRSQEPSRISIQAREPDDGTDYVEISVEDNGIGFDQKYAERIFTVFQRLHGRQTYPGSGIGLAICRKIVSRHGGEISARSAPAEGSTFFVTLSKRQTGASEEAPVTEAANP